MLKIQHRHPEAYHGCFEKTVGALGGGEEADEIEPQAKAAGLDLIRLIAPTTDEARLREQLGVVV